MHSQSKSSYQHDISSESDSLIPSKHDLDVSYHEDSQYFCIFIPVSWIFNTEHLVIDTPSNTPSRTIFLLLNAMIGSGILAQSYVFYHAGWLAAIIEYVIIGYLSYTGASLLIEAAAKVNIHTYAGLCEYALGQYGKTFLELSIIANNFGCLLAYLLIIGSLLHDVITSSTSSYQWYTSSLFLMVIVTVAIIWPMCMIRAYGHLAIASMISITAITVVVMLVMIGGPLTSDHIQAYDNMHIISISGMFNTIGSVIFAFGYTAVVFHSYHAMIPQKPDVFNQVAWKTTLIGGMMCGIVGIIGAYCFENLTKSDILENFSGILGRIFQLIVVIHLVLYVPGDFIVMRASCMNLIGRDVLSESNIVYMVLSMLLLGSVLIIACIILMIGDSDSLAMILDLTGGIAGCMINFLIPGLVARQVLWDDDHHDKTPMRWKINILLIAGVIIPLLVCYSTIINDSI